MIDYVLREGMLSDAEISTVTDLEKSIFSTPHSFEYLKYEMSNKTKLLSLFARSEGEFIGYKIGFENKQDLFYSWIGGVVPDFRNQGIAKELMNRQHIWLRANEFSRVETQTQNEFKAMLCFNLLNGFDITGTSITQKNVIRITLQKTL